MLFSSDVIDHIISTSNESLAKAAIKSWHSFHKLTAWNQTFNLIHERMAIKKLQAHANKMTMQVLAEKEISA